jgi:hypothetical protein
VTSSNYGIYATTTGSSIFYFNFLVNSGWITNATILPNSNGSAQLGTSGQNWGNVYTQQLNINPSTDGVVFDINNSLGTNVFKVNTNSSNSTLVQFFAPSSTAQGTPFENLYIVQNLMAPGADSGNGNFELGSGSRFFSSIYVNNIICNGTILYNYNNSSAYTGYPTMDSVYTYEFVVTASNIIASTYPVGAFIHYPNNKSAANIRKLEALMYDGTNSVPDNYTATPAYAFSVGANSSGIFVTTASTWTQTSGSKTFYVWITTT